LIHFAVGDGYQFLVRYFGLNPSVVLGDIGGVLMRGAFIVVMSFGIAMLSRKYLEEPFLQLKASFPQTADSFSQKSFDKVVCTAMEVPPNQDLA
jgi:peptidoglycan/LPS O-acetylase OafA/YrhL